MRKLNKDDELLHFKKTVGPDTAVSLDVETVGDANTEFICGDNLCTVQAQVWLVLMSISLLTL